MYLISSTGVVHEATREPGISSCGKQLRANYIYRQTIPSLLRIVETKGPVTIEPRKCRLCFNGNDSN